MAEVMKKVEIDVPASEDKAARRFGLIVIGDEILSGRRQDKHMSRLIESLNERGLSLRWAKYVVDDPEPITATLKDRDRRSTRLNSSHTDISRMPSSA